MSFIYHRCSGEHSLQLGCYTQVQVGHYSESSESAFAVAAPEEKAFLRVCLYQATNELCVLQLDFTVLFIITYDK